MKLDYYILLKTMKKTSVDIESGPWSIKRAGMLQFSIFQTINNVYFFWAVQLRLCTWLSLFRVLKQPASTQIQVLSICAFFSHKGYCRNTRTVGSIIFLQSSWALLLLVSTKVISFYKQMKFSSETTGVACLAVPRRFHVNQFLHPTKISSFHTMLFLLAVGQ